MMDTANDNDTEHADVSQLIDESRQANEANIIRNRQKLH